MSVAEYRKYCEEVREVGRAREYAKILEFILWEKTCCPFHHNSQTLIPFIIDEVDKAARVELEQLSLPDAKINEERLIARSTAAAALLDGFREIEEQDSRNNNREAQRMLLSYIITAWLEIKDDKKAADFGTRLLCITAPDYSYYVCGELEKDLREQIERNVKGEYDKERMLRRLHHLLSVAARIPSKCQPGTVRTLAHAHDRYAAISEVTSRFW